MGSEYEVKYQKLREDFDFFFEDWDNRWVDISEEEYMMYRVDKECKGIRKILVHGPTILEILEEYTQFGEDLFKIRN